MAGSMPTMARRLQPEQRAPAQPPQPINANNQPPSNNPRSLANHPLNAIPSLSPQNNKFFSHKRSNPMKTKQSLVYGLIAVLFALTLTACPEPNPNPDPEHTHTYATTWSSDDTQHWHECTAHDGAKTDVADHDWEWQETTPATTTADGEETETCKICGAASGDTRPIAQLQPQLCACLTTYGTTAHLGMDEGGNVAACNCGGNPCNCTEQTATVGGKTIRKVSSVTVDQMNDAVTNINYAYGYLADAFKITFTGRVTTIQIVSGNEVTHEGTILKVGIGADGDSILDYLMFTLLASEPAVSQTPQQITFGTNLSTTITGPAMTGTQWNTVIANLTKALDDAAKDGDTLGAMTVALFTPGYNIELVKNPTEGYDYYKVDGEVSKIFLNADYVIGATVADLSAKVALIINNIFTGGPTQAKAPANDNGLERLNREVIALGNQRVRVANGRSIG
jgi:hypothetical protein